MKVTDVLFRFELNFMFPILVLHLMIKKLISYENNLLSSLSFFSFIKSYS